MIKKALNRSFLSRPLSEAEMIQVYTAMRKSRRLQRDTWSDGSWCYQAYWITGEIFDLKYFAPTRHLGATAQISGLSRVGRPMRAEWWDELWRDDVPGRKNFTVAFNFGHPGLPANRKSLHHARIQKYQTGTNGELVRWSVSWYTNEFDNLKAKEKLNSLPPEFYLPVCQQILQLFYFDIPLRIEMGELIMDYSPEYPDGNAKEANPEEPVVYYSGSPVNGKIVMRGYFSAAYVRKCDAKTVMDRILTYYGDLVVVVEEWQHTYEFANLGQAQTSLPAVEPPPYKVNFHGTPPRVYEPGELVQFRDTKGEFIPLGYFSCGPRYYTVEALSLGNGPAEQWRLVFNASEDTMTDKARAKDQALMEKVINLPELFACEQLVEKYAPLCR